MTESQKLRAEIARLGEPHHTDARGALLVAGAVEIEKWKARALKAEEALREIDGLLGDDFMKMDRTDWADIKHIVRAHFKPQL